MLDIKFISFVTLVECKNYTKAALKLHLTQPAISQHIKKLEEYYNCKLINQNGKNFELTEHGQSLYNYALIALANEENLLNQLKDESTQLRLGSTLSIADYFLHEFKLDYNEISDIKVANTDTLIDDLISNNLDCAFIEGNFNRKIFDHKTFKLTNFIALVNANHPLANKPIKLHQIFEYPLIIREEGSGTRNILVSYLSLNNQSIHNFKALHVINNFRSKSVV